MPVKYFVSQDSQGREQAPDYSHETLAVIDIINKVYATFNHHPHLYALIVNLDDQEAAADLLIITERGIGVVELKHYAGDIFQQGTRWYARYEGQRIAIKAGSDNKGFHNPHEQVQTYADVIRDDLLESPLRQRPWLPGSYSEREAFKFATAVCFTNPDASLYTFKESYRRKRKRPNLKSWQQFTILTPNDIPAWVAALRFEANKGRAHHYQAHRFTPKQIMRIVTDLFCAKEWSELDGLMPTGDPYAYLFLKQNGKVMIRFGLSSDEVTIGRSSKCDVTIPRQFTRVSSEHAKILRFMNGIAIQDESTNGTFINDKRLTKSKRFPLMQGLQLILGGEKPTEKVCLLEFSFTPPQPSATERGTQL